MTEENIDRELSDRISNQYDTNDANKESSEGESKSAKGGRYPLADLTKGSKSAVTTGAPECPLFGFSLVGFVLPC